MHRQKPTDKLRSQTLRQSRLKLHEQINTKNNKHLDKCQQKNTPRIVRMKAQRMPDECPTNARRTVQRTMQKILQLDRQ